MDVSVTSSTRGEIRHLTISISATEVETIGLIDSLSIAGGYPEIIAGRIASVVGLVDVRADEDADHARSLRHIAERLERRG